jgi:hypothetical protein
MFETGVPSRSAKDDRWTNRRLGTRPEVETSTGEPPNGSPLDGGRLSRTTLRRRNYLNWNEAMIGMASPTSWAKRAGSVESITMSPTIPPPRSTKIRR